MPILLPALERNGHLRLKEEIRGKVQTMSAATIDRLLRTPRNATRVGKRPEWRRSRGVVPPPHLVSKYTDDARKPARAVRPRSMRGQKSPEVVTRRLITRLAGLHRPMGQAAQSAGSSIPARASASYLPRRLPILLCRRTALITSDESSASLTSCPSRLTSLFHVPNGRMIRTNCASAVSTPCRQK